MSQTPEDVKIVCPECQTLNPVHNRFCGKCGASLEDARIVRSHRAPPSATRPWPSPRKKGSGWTAVLVIGGILFFGAIGLCLAMALAGALVDSTPMAARPTPQTKESSVSGGPSSVPASTPTPQPTARPTPIPIAPPFAEIRQLVQAMTEAQWKAYLSSLEGQRVERWQGWVDDVNPTLSGRYELWVDMDPPEDFSVYDVQFDVPEDLALTFLKEQQVTFSGTIERVSEFLGSLTVHLVDVQLH